MHLSTVVTVVTTLVCGVAHGQTPPDFLTLLSQTPSLSMYEKFIKSDARLVSLFNYTVVNSDVFLANNAGIDKFEKTPFGGLLNDKQTVYDSTLYAVVPLGTGSAPDCDAVCAARKQTLGGPGSFFHTLRDNATLGNVTGGQVLETQKTSKGVSISSGLETVSNIVNGPLVFNNGKLYVLDYPFSPPQNITLTGEATNNGYINNLTRAGKIAPLEGLHDITLFIYKNSRYDVVCGTVAYSSFFHPSGSIVKTTQGKALTLTQGTGANASSLFVNGLPVSMRDILVDNGVVHIVA